jgi:hypothetical protein
MRGPDCVVTDHVERADREPHDEAGLVDQQETTESVRTSGGTRIPLRNTITVDTTTIGPSARSRRTGGPCFRYGRSPEWYCRNRKPVVDILIPTGMISSISDGHMSRKRSPNEQARHAGHREQRDKHQPSDHRHLRLPSVPPPVKRTAGPPAGGPPRPPATSRRRGSRAHDDELCPEQLRIADESVRSLTTRVRAMTPSRVRLASAGPPPVRANSVNFTRNRDKSVDSELDRRQAGTRQSPGDSDNQSGSGRIDLAARSPCAPTRTPPPATRRCGQLR